MNPIHHDHVLDLAVRIKHVSGQKEYLKEADRELTRQLLTANVGRLRPLRDGDRKVRVHRTTAGGGAPRKLDHAGLKAASPRIYSEVVTITPPPAVYSVRLSSAVHSNRASKEWAAHNAEGRRIEAERWAEYGDGAWEDPQYQAKMLMIMRAALRGHDSSEEALRIELSEYIAANRLPRTILGRADGKITASEASASKSVNYDRLLREYPQMSRYVEYLSPRASYTTITFHNDKEQ